MSPTHSPESSSRKAAQGAAVGRRDSPAPKAKTTRIRKTTAKAPRNTTVSGSKRSIHTIVHEHHHFHIRRSPRRKISRRLRRLEAALATLMDRVEVHEIEARQAVGQRTEAPDSPPATPRRQRSPTPEGENGQARHPLLVTPPLQRDQPPESKNSLSPRIMLSMLTPG